MPTALTLAAVATLAGAVVAAADKVKTLPARTSGGTTYFPAGGIKGAQELAAVCARVALELRQRYALAFYPADAAAARAWRKLSVRVNPPAGTGKLRLAYRKAYRAAGK